MVIETRARSARTDANDTRPGAERLRGTVLRVGEMLGWRTPEVIAFAEALTGCPWPRCGADELRMVLIEYRDIAAAAATRLARRAARLAARRMPHAPED